MSWGAGLRAAEFLLGLCLLYVGFGLYETEEGRLEDVLARLWIRVDDYASSTHARFERLLQETALISVRFFDVVLGPKALSLRAISASGLLTYASLLIFATALVVPEPEVPQRFEILWVSLGISSAIVLAVFSPSLIRRRWARWIPIGAFLLITALIVLHGRRVYAGSTSGFGFAVRSVPVLALTIIVDFLWVVTVRFVTKWASMRAGAWRHALVILTSAVIIAVYFVAVRNNVRVIERSYGEVVVMTLILVASSRLYLVFVSAVQLLALTAAFAHWMVWPALSRLVYAAERYKFFRKRRFFGALGIALIAHAFAGTWLAETIAFLHR